MTAHETAVMRALIERLRLPPEVAAMYLKNLDNPLLRQLLEAAKPPAEWLQ